MRILLGHLAMTSWSRGTVYSMVVGLHTSHGLDFRDTSAIPTTGDFQGMLVLGRQTADSENLDLRMFCNATCIVCTCGPDTARSLRKPSGSRVLTEGRFGSYHLPNCPSRTKLHRRLSACAL